MIVCWNWLKEYVDLDMSHDELVDRLREDYATANLDDVDRALCDHAAKLTRDPSSVSPADLGRLRAVGLSDRAISDATQTIAYFNYINRIADGLGVDLEPGMR